MCVCVCVCVYVCTQIDVFVCYHESVKSVIPRNTELFNLILKVITKDLWTLATTSSAEYRPGPI